jgi:hypothetical protein
MNAALAVLPHDGAVRRAVELLCKGSPILRTGSACDLSCTYCCVGADGPPLQPVESVRRRIDSLRALGHKGVGYMGGEPTIHPGFLDIVRHAASSGFEHQMLCTNGVKLGDADFAARVFEAGVHSITTSLDAFETKVQEPLYGGRPVHRQALSGLQNALGAPGIEVLLSAVVTALNAPLLPGYMLEVARLQSRYGKPIGVMLCALQQPAVSSPKQNGLALGMIEATKLVDKALSGARAAEVAAFTFGFPPCLFERGEQNVSEFYATEWELDLATGAVERSRLHDPSTYWADCATCAHAGYCPGVMRQYADAAVQAHVASLRGGGTTPARAETAARSGTR